MENMDDKKFKKVITVGNSSQVQTVSYKYKFKFKNFMKAIFYATIILGSIFNFYGICFAVIWSVI